jgi:glycosyltransferase involved in cell wall biosynthesis
MHILLTIHDQLDRNTGGPGVILRLAEQYRDRGHRVTILSYSDIPARLQPTGLAPLVFPWLVAYRIGQMAQELDVVDASFGDTWPCLERRAWRRRTSKRALLFVTHSHGLPHLAHRRRVADADRGRLKLSWKYAIYRGGFRLWETARSFQRADVALFLNRHELHYAVTELNVAPERARLVANGLSRAFLGLPFEETPSEADKGLGIAQVGTYLEHKGIRYGAPALNRILKEYPSVRVGFFGTRYGPEVVLEDFDTEVRDRIHVIPKYENGELAGLLQGYQIKLFPTLCEGFGNALIEAMSCGLAPVTTAVPGPTEIVVPDLEGLIVPPGNSQAIEGALRQLIENRALLDRLRRNAYRKAQHYSWTRIAAERLALYEEFLTPRGATPLPIA